MSCLNIFSAEYGPDYFSFPETNKLIINLPFVIKCPIHGCNEYCIDMYQINDGKIRFVCMECLDFPKDEIECNFNTSSGKSIGVRRKK